MGRALLVLCLVLTAFFAGRASTYDDADVGSPAAASAEAGGASVSAGDEAPSATASGKSGTWRDGDDLRDFSATQFGVKVAIPKSWKVECAVDVLSFRPEGVEDAELVMWCDKHFGADAEAMLADIRDANARIAEDLREEGYAVVESEVKDMQVNGIQAQLVNYRAVAKDSSMIRGERIGYALPQRCVYYEFVCPAYLHDEYARLADESFASVQSPEVDGTETRFFVDEEDELHVEMPDYSFDLPESWLGRVDIERRDDGSMGVFVAGDYACGIMSVSIRPETLSYGGDIGGGPFRIENTGDGRIVFMSMAVYPSLVATSLSFREEGEALLVSLGISDDAVREAIDLETGGALTLDDVLARSGSGSSEFFGVVRDYMTETIASTLVLHPVEGLSE